MARVKRVLRAKTSGVDVRHSTSANEQLAALRQLLATAGSALAELEPKDHPAIAGQGRSMVLACFFHNDRAHSADLHAVAAG